MFRTIKIRSTLKASLLLLAALLLSFNSLAQQGADETLEEVIVTGSYIKGSPEDAELPIDVINSEDLVNLGSPSVIELVRNLGVSTANLGETNQFTTSGQANEGVATVNLRGLGAARTLVLLNGSRQVPTETEGADINAIPTNAIGRVEVLKDGAAALYGSDAVGGVVNFIMRDGFEGFEVGGSYQMIEDAGDYSINATFGTVGDNWDFMFALEYGEREELRIRDRDWALVTTNINDPGGWSNIANPARTFFRVPVDRTASIAVSLVDTMGTAATTDDTTRMVNLTSGIGGMGSFIQVARNDTQCEKLGAIRPSTGNCGFQYAYFDNLIEQTEQYKTFAQFNYEFAGGHNFHAELMISEVDLPAWKTSPSYPPQTLFGSDRELLADHPGLMDYLSHYNVTKASLLDNNAGLNADLRRAVATALGRTDDDGEPTTMLMEDEEVEIDATNVELLSTEGIYAISLSRAMGVTGAFLTGEPEEAQRITETMRFAASMDGDFADGSVSYDVGLSFSSRERTIGGQDMYIERMALALKGYGGPNCRPEIMRGTDGNPMDTDPNMAGVQYGLTAASEAMKGDRMNCFYYNPFSRAISFSAINGARNEDYNEDQSNPVELLRWLIADTGSTTTNDLLVLDAVFTGETNWEIGGGTISWAAGFQHRQEDYDFDVLDIADRSVNPCPFTDPASAALGLVGLAQLGTGCRATGQDAGRLAFLAATEEEKTDRDVQAIFAELAMPFSDDLNAQLAVRYETYGGSIGDTFDPKFAMSWTPTDNLTVRGSASTTFRAPPASLLSGTGTGLSYVPATLSFKAIDTVGNKDLKPEKALSTNLGVIWKDDGFYASVDYWRFAFDDSFQTESFNAILSAYTSNGCTTPTSAEGMGATCVELRDRIQFSAQAPTGTTLAATERIEVSWINGEEIVTSGIDFDIGYAFEDVLPGTLALELEGSYVLEFDRDAQLDKSGTIQLAPADDIAGKLNYNLGAAFTSKPQLKLAGTVAFTNNDHHASLIARFVDAYEDTGLTAAQRADYPHLIEIDSHVTFDAHYVWRGIEGLALSANIINLTDEDPPAARGDLNYDPFTHNAFGRMIKLSVTYTMDQ